MNNDTLKRRSYYQPKPLEPRGLTLLNKRASSCTEIFRTPDRTSKVSINRNKSQVFARGQRCPPKTLECCNPRTKQLALTEAYHHQKDCSTEPITDAAQKISPLSERGVPEGQEDPDLFSSQTFLNEQNKLIHASTPKRSSRLSSMLSLYQSVPNLQLLFKSFKQTSKTLSSEEKSAINKWAKEKIRDRVNLPFPEFSKTNLIRSDVSSLNGNVAKQSSANVDNDLVSSSVVSCSISLEEDRVIRTFGCVRYFYSGKPLRCNLVVSSKCAFVSDSCSTIVWKADLSSFHSIEVRWNYSVLLLRSLRNGVTSEIFMNFLDPSELRFATSLLSIVLMKTGKDANIISAESPWNCRLFWKSTITKWAIEQNNDKDFEDFNLKYVGLIYFEESLCALDDPSALTNSNNASYLMYRWSGSGSWQAGYFKISAGMLCQYNQCADQVPNVSMSLGEDECKGYGRNFNSPRPHTLEIQFHGGRCLFLAAASEAEANDWLNLLSQALITGSLNHTKHPTACGLLISEKDAVVFQFAQNFTVLSSTRLEAISVIRVCEDDTSCLVEFDYREAHEDGGDWVLYFQSESSFSEFLNAAQCPQEQLPETSSSILRNKNLNLKSSS